MDERRRSLIGLDVGREIERGVVGRRKSGIGATFIL